MTAAAPQQPANATVTLSGDREVHIERIVNAPRDRVWKALTDPALIAQWWGRGNKLDIEKHEPVRGGHWRYVEHAHGETHGFEGRFAEVVPESKIVSTFEWDGMPGHVALQTMMLEDLGDGRTRATYTLDSDPGRVLGMLLRGPVEATVTGMLVNNRPDELKARVEGG